MRENVGALQLLLSCKVLWRAIWPAKSISTNTTRFLFQIFGNISMALGTLAIH